jgi:twitching motility protein PilT
VAVLSAREIIARGVELGASDIHLTALSPPVYRVNGSLIAWPDYSPLSQEDSKRLAEEIIPHSDLGTLLMERGQVDFANDLPGVGRIRVNTFIQRGSWASAIRLIPHHIPQLNALGLPELVQKFAQKEKGLILVTGVAGSGKSTTLAAMLDYMNRSRSLHILTLEDPIEYRHRNNRCIINQREIGSDTQSFAMGLRAALRQDPDVIMVGEMRDLESISIVITAAETGHLVLASLHSATATQSLERIVDVFPAHQQSQICIQLAGSLLGIISQQLIPRADGEGRVVAAEVLVATPAIRNLIRENKRHQIYSAMQTGGSSGMITMEKALKNLYQQGLITREEAHIRRGLTTLVYVKPRHPPLSYQCREPGQLFSVRLFGPG